MDEEDEVLMHLMTMPNSTNTTTTTTSTSTQSNSASSSSPSQHCPCRSTVESKADYHYEVIGSTIMQSPLPWEKWIAASSMWYSTCCRESCKRITFLVLLDLLRTEVEPSFAQMRIGRIPFVKFVKQNGPIHVVLTLYSPSRRSIYAVLYLCWCSTPRYQLSGHENHSKDK